ncbi:MAG: exosortase/archaeosortase family protein [Candidatus Hodarchaeales archaeon]
MSRLLLRAKFDQYYWILIAVLCIILTGILYIQFQTTRDFLYVPLALISFTVAMYFSIHYSETLQKYEHIIIPFTIGMIIFMLFLDDDLFGFPNPFKGVNDAVLNSTMADYQIYLTTVISVGFLQYLFIFLILIACILGMDLFRKIKNLKKSNFKIIDHLKAMNWLDRYLYIALFVSEIFLIPTFILLSFFGLFFQVDVGLPFEMTLISNSESVVKVPQYGSARILPVRVNEACSGIHSLLIFLSCFYLAFLYIGRDVPRKILLIALAAGTIGTLSSNWVRVILVLLVGYFVDFEAMMQFHDYAGLIVFLIWMLFFWKYALDYMETPRNLKLEKIDAP